MILDELEAHSGLDWSSVIVDAASVRAKKGGSLAGPNPVDRGKAGSELHVLTDAQGLPWSSGCPLQTSTTSKHLARSSLGSRPSARAAVLAGDAPKKFGPIRLTTRPAT